MTKIIIIGGGAAGMYSAAVASDLGAEVTLIEKNEKLGKKVYITGKGRCNLLNLTSPENYLASVVNGSRFMNGPIYSLPPQKTYDYFENDLGLPLVTTRGNRVFPSSEKASDVTKALENRLKGNGVKIMLNTTVESITFSAENNAANGVILSGGTKLFSDCVIIATGGLSYQATGSTGDGYLFAKSAGHTINKCYPSLCGLILKDYDGAAAGLTLKNSALTVLSSGKKVFYEEGEILFTHKGISGPVVLTASAKVNRLNNLKAVIDLKPYIDEKTTDERLLKIMEENKNKDLENVLKVFVPQNTVKYVLKQSGVDPKIKINSLSKENRYRLVKAVKNLSFDVISTEGFECAVITSGGVDLKEINPKTMESKLCKSLFFAGEVIDVDCLTGGFNLQEAFSTAYVAAKSAAQKGGNNV